MNKHANRKVSFQIAAALLLGCTWTFDAVAAGEGGHRHHVGAAAGYARHENENSTFVGLDYVYRFGGGPWAAGVFYEEVFGDFDLQAWGVTGGYFFSNGFKLGAGIGAEYKIKKDKTLALVHITAGYDWHFGNWSVGPVATVDFIENGSQTYYLGLSAGYGF